jgi:hypothetical protein
MKSLFASVLLICSISGFAQKEPDSLSLSRKVIDSVFTKGLIFDSNRKKPDIKLSIDQALKFLKERNQPHHWNNTQDPLRRVLGQLINEASYIPFDSVEYFLNRYPFDSIGVSWDKFYNWEPVKLKVPFVISPGSLVHFDSLTHEEPVRIIPANDSLKLLPPKVSELEAGEKSPSGLKDTTILVLVDTLHEVKSTYHGFPFNYYNYPYQSDSIQVAVRSLLKYIEDRDSSIIHFTGPDNEVTPVWLNSKSDIEIKYWLKNELGDSVTVWIGTPLRNTIRLYLEKGVSFRRPMKQSKFTDARIDVKSQDKSKLLEVQRIITRQKFWKYRSESSFIFSQAALTNWVKGGESSISLVTDVTGYADYINKSLKLSSNNFARLKFGYISLGDNPIRKNLDLLETNSKLNHKAFGKFDFSAVMLFKTQVGKGYNYPNDSVPVSKFMNPATLTIGLGLDYKPNKKTSINFSPLSYKGTFVPDTAHIDQTLYGIPKNRRSLNEPGASLMITNEFSKFKNISVINRVQFFTNYINKPQNIDVDWEMIAVATINWFMDVRFNTHLIYEDDAKTPVLDHEKKPVIGPDGKPKKSSRIQFKELLGFSFVFRF